MGDFYLMRRMVHRLLCLMGYCISPSHQWQKAGKKMMRQVEKDIKSYTLPPLHGGYRPRPGPDGKYRDISTPPKPPKGSGGGSR